MRRLAAYAWAGAGIAVLYLAWVATTRYLADRRMEQTIRERTTPRSIVTEDPAGKGLKILHFYAGSGEVFRGDHVVICYGLQDARSVRIEPPVEKLSPSSNRCFAAAPERTTTYTLVAEGFDGRQAVESFTVQVKPPPPSILFVALSDREVRAGDSLTVCYGVKNASSVRLEPTKLPLAPLEKTCVKFYPKVTITYALVAAGAEGRTDREAFTVKVK